MDLSVRQIVPKLADQGKYLASESSIYRILKAADLLAHRGKSKAKTVRPIPQLVATGPNQIWSWDITYLNAPIKGKFYYLYLFMDIWSRKIVGWEVYEQECMNLSAKVLNDACTMEKIDQNQLTVHSDNGGPMKGATMLATMQRLGVVPSFSRPSVSNDNAFSESLFKTLKYRPGYPSEEFRDLAHAKEWVRKFVGWYNEHHLHSGINFVTPSDRHNKRADKVLERRASIYEQARAKNPLRWSGKTRDWSVGEVVVLNGLNNQDGLGIKMAS